MNKPTTRLPDAELEIMLIIWKTEELVTSAYILKRLQRNWSLSTLMTVLSRLTKKRFLICEKQGRNNFYRALIDEEEYKQSESKSLLEKLYGSSFKNLVTSLYEGNTINDDDLNELRRFIDGIEKEK